MFSDIGAGYFAVTEQVIIVSNSGDKWDTYVL